MNDLEQLKELLFGAEKEALDSISERVARREIRTDDVADILPEAIHQSHKKDGELVESLTGPVGESLQRALRDDPQTYSDALYPVMGPAIRKSIMHALRNFTEQINEAVEHSFSVKGLKWRWQASRSGVPFGEYLLQKTLKFRVEQAYLISRENGLLVGHVHHEASKIKDSDAVSAMFTAIQDFVKESFSPDRTGRLESADMGDFTLWAMHGPHALLVCVIRGVPPKSLRADLSAILERIHFRYGDAIREYKGDTSTIPDVEVELERCLRFEAREESTGKRSGPPKSVVVLGLILVFAIAFLGARSWMYSLQGRELRESLDATPGIYVRDIERNGGHFTVQGLKDPLAPRVVDVAGKVRIPADRMTVSMQPFQSLQPELVALRATQMFGRPGTAQFAVDGTTLVVSGDAPWAWQRQVRERFGMLAGVDSLDTSHLTAGDRQQFADSVAGLSDARFYFRQGVDFADGNEQALRELGASLSALSDEAAEFDLELSAALKGSTDATGERAVNAALAQGRAIRVADILVGAGIDARIIRQTDAAMLDGEPVEDVSKRFVQVDLQLQPSP